MPFHTLKKKWSKDILCKTENPYNAEQEKIFIATPGKKA